MEKLSLRGARVNAGLTVVEAAEIIGMTRQRLNGWEIDSTKISYERLIQLAELYSTPFTELFIGPEKEYHEQLKAGDGFKDHLMSVLDKRVKKLTREHSKLFNTVGVDGAELSRLTSEVTELTTLLSNMMMKDYKDNQVYELLLNSELYGIGSFSYIESLIRDYVETSKMYGNSECDFKICMRNGRDKQWND